MRAILNTGRTIPQGVAVEEKESYEYRASASVCYLNPVDIMELGIEEGGRIRLTSPAGSVVLSARAAEGLARGEVFVPLGPYANHIIGVETHATGMPDFKSAEIEVAVTGDPVKDINGLMEEIGGVRYDR